MSSLGASFRIKPSPYLERALNELIKRNNKMFIMFKVENDFPVSVSLLARRELLKWKIEEKNTFDVF